MFATASGKAILTYQADEFVEDVMRRFATKFTDRRVVTLGEIKADIARARKRGYSVNKGELHSDVGAVGAPVIRPDVSVEAALSLVFPIAGISHTRIVELGEQIAEAGKHLSRDLGWLGSKARRP